MSARPPTDKGTVDEEALHRLAALTSGSGHWTTAALEDVRAVRFADGPLGLRVQDDDAADHLGLQRSVPATCFPAPVTLASSWDVDLVLEIACALGREARSHGIDVLLGPGMNIKRSPLAGRNFEYFSEDPFVTAVMAAAVVSGIQGEGVAACIKHFAVNNQETDRLSVSAEVDERTLREIYLRAFEYVLRTAAPKAVMTSYNRLNGEYTSQHPWLLRDLLRGEWSFDGLVISDWGGIQDRVQALAAGLDVEMPFAGDAADRAVAAAVTGGTLPRPILDDVARRLRELTAALDALTSDPVPPDLQAHHLLTRRAAAAGTVLLKNEGHLLPLDPDGRGRVVVLGDFARAPRFQGAGSSLVNPTKVDDPWVHLIDRAGPDLILVHVAGYDVEKALAAVNEADVVLVFCGLPPSAEAEGSDRTDLALPADQVRIIRAVSAVHPAVIVSLFNGAVVTTSEWEAAVPAIVDFWLAGQAVGGTVSDVLFGDVPPSGKLTETIPRRLQDTPAFLNFPGEQGTVRYGEGVFVGYRWYDARDLDVSYPFGHGLTYTQFEFGGLVTGPNTAGDGFCVDVEVGNIGSRAGSEVVQVYAMTASEHMLLPVRQLVAFRKVNLQPGERMRVRLEVPRERLQYFHPGLKRWVLEPGEVRLEVGASSRALGPSAVVQVDGEAVELPLTASSTLGEWLAHPTAGPAFTKLTEVRGGPRGRVADLFGDPVGRRGLLSLPMASLAAIVAWPIDRSDVDHLLEQMPHKVG